MAKTEDLTQKARETVGMANVERARILCPQNTSELCNRLLHDPEYRDLWFKTVDQLNATDDAVKAEQAEVERKLEEMRAKVPKLSDGRAIFQDKDGRWYDENNNPVSVQEAQEALNRQKQEQQ